MEDARRAHEAAAVHSIYTPTECDVCEGDLDAEPFGTNVVCRTDSQIADHEYEQGPYQDGRCAIDGWYKFEHELNRDLVVHGSCFLDHDDVLVRV